MRYDYLKQDTLSRCCAYFKYAFVSLTCNNHKQVGCSKINETHDIARYTMGFIYLGTPCMMIKNKPTR